MWRMSRALSAPDFDLVLFPTIYSYVPVFSPARKLVMAHDVIAETYPKLTVPGARDRLFWRYQSPPGVLAGRCADYGFGIFACRHSATFST